MDTKTTTCTDCSGSFEQSKFGRTSPRCPDCKKDRERERSRLAQAAYRSRDPERTAIGRRKAYRKRRETDPGYNRRRTLWQYHKIRPEQYDEMLAGQRGVCAICGGPPVGQGMKMQVDHNHRCCPGPRSCGKCNRGLLCAKCNTALGLLHEDVALFSAAVEYLARWTSSAPAD